METSTTQVELALLFFPTDEELEQEYNKRPHSASDVLEKRLLRVFYNFHYRDKELPLVKECWQTVRDEIFYFAQGCSSIKVVFRAIEVRTAKNLGFEVKELYSQDAGLLKPMIFAHVCAACNIPFLFLVPPLVNDSWEYRRDYQSRSIFSASQLPKMVVRRLYNPKDYADQVKEYLKALNRPDLVYVRSKADLNKYGCPRMGDYKSPPLI